MTQMRNGWCAPSEKIYELAGTEAAVRPVPPRTFDLVRFHDVSGVSGEGIVAQGVQFADGQVALQWPKPGRSVAVWDSVDDLLRIHGHNGLTVVRFHDGED